MFGRQRIQRRWREWTAQVPAQQVSQTVSFVYFALHVVLGLLCAFAPLSIASSPAVTRYADLLANIIPSIGELARVSSFPSHTRLALAVLWTCVPISACIVARVPWFWIPNMTGLRRHPSMLIVATLLFGFIIFTMVRFDVNVSDVSGRSYFDRFTYALSSFRALLGIMSGLMCATVAVCIGALCRIPAIAREALHDDFG
jgi:hypothetical protein